MIKLKLLCEKITDDCASIRRALIVIYVELTVLILVGTFDLDVSIGKTLCR